MVSKENIKEVIRYFQDFAATIEVTARPVFLEDYNYVFVGLRRVGKTYMLYQQIQQLIKNSPFPTAVFQT